VHDDQLVHDDGRLRELVFELPRHIVTGLGKQCFGGERYPQAQGVTQQTVLVTRA
jgi:hypothetical protein